MKSTSLDLSHTFDEFLLVSGGVASCAFRQVQAKSEVALPIEIAINAYLNRSNVKSPLIRKTTRLSSIKLAEKACRCTYASVLFCSEATDLASKQRSWEFV